MEAIESIIPRSLSRLEGKTVSHQDQKTVSTKEKQLQEVPVDKGQQIEKEVRTKVEHIAEAMDEYVKSNRRDLRIQVHKATGVIMVKVISQDDGKVIREIPPEEVLNLAAKMEKMMGVLYDGNV